MVYFTVFLFLSLFSVIELYLAGRSKKKEYLFYISSFLVFAFCSLRYNVGTDAGTYLRIYSQVPDSLFSNDDLSGIKGEYLFLKFFILLKSIGIMPPLGNAIVIATTNLLFLRFIYKYSPYKCFSVLILFSWYFVYIFCALRQGLAMGVFLGIAYPFLEQKKYVHYYIAMLAAMLFHTAAVIAFLVPLALRILRKASKYQITVLSVIFFIIALIPNSLLLSIAEVIDKGELYIEDSSISYMALLNRILAFLIVFILFNPVNERYKNMKSIYIAGFFIYLLTAQSELISSRLAAVFKSVDIVLIPLVLTNLSNKYKPVFMIAMCIYLGFMLMHLLSAIAILYKVDDVWQYPYKMLFGKDYYYDNW
jgi:hypothetical protein